MVGRVLAVVLLIGLLRTFPVTPALAAQPMTAQITYRGVFDCFEPTLNQPQADGEAIKLTTCETSAAIAANGQLYTASDKEIPGASSVMTLDLAGDTLTRNHYVDSPPILRLQKAEDFAVLPGGDRVFLTSSFDRMRSDSTDWDAYNTLLTWTVGQEDQVQVIEPTGHPETSLSLRLRLQRALPTADFPAGAPYFKVEGLASLPNNRLLFGIREIGQDYENFDYTLQLVATQWDEAAPQALGNFERIYEYDPQTHPQIHWPVGLSGLAWDAVHEQLLMLTSYERDETDIGLGAYLWTLSLEALAAQVPPTLVTQANGRPLQFAHKAEAITVLPDGRLLVIHDDDRVLGNRLIFNPEVEFYREPHQAAYTLVEWSD